MISADDPVWQRFLELAGNFITLVDTSGREDQVQRFSGVHASLLALQLTALQLPETAASNEDPAMVTEAKRADRARLKDLFDLRYVMAEQVLEVPARATPADIRELWTDLADIYDTLQDILALNEHRYYDDAASLARDGYIEDWGYLAVSVQAALWKFVAEAKIAAEESAEDRV